MHFLSGCFLFESCTQLRVLLYTIIQSTVGHSWCLITENDTEQMSVKLAMGSMNPHELTKETNTTHRGLHLLGQQRS